MATSAARIEVVHDDPKVVRPSISDDELLELLRSAGTPAGLVRTGSELFIVPRTPSPKL